MERPRSYNIRDVLREDRLDIHEKLDQERFWESWKEKFVSVGLNPERVDKQFEKYKETEDAYNQLSTDKDFYENLGEIFENVFSSLQQRNGSDAP